MRKKFCLIIILILSCSFIVAPISEKNFLLFNNLNQTSKQLFCPEKNANDFILSDSSMTSEQTLTGNNLDIALVGNVTFSTDFFNGYNLFLLRRENKTSYARFCGITDMNGNIIMDFSDRAIVPTAPLRFINSTTILSGSSKGGILSNIYNDTIVEFGVKGHHEYEYNSKSNTVFTFNRYLETINQTDYYYDQIQEYTITGELIWSLNTSSFIAHTYLDPFGDIHDQIPEVTHSNSIFYDPEDDVLYFNPRNVNTFYKINHSSGAVIWGLGEYGNFTLYDKYGRERESLFYHAHALKKVDDNTFILFDNDHHNKTDPNSNDSRILEITIDEATMTANESWSWTAPEDYYSRYWGDADRLPNGNRLGTFGTKTHPNTEIGARLVEVNEGGEIVWEMNFPNTEGYTYGIYRMDRVWLSPILDSSSDIITSLKDDVIVNWNTWYNFRTRECVEGSYKLFLDSNQISSGSHIFDKSWRATNLTFNLGRLGIGIHNLTLAVVDEAGHTTVDNVNLTITPFYLQRNGPTTVEEGQKQAQIIWTGETISPLAFELRVNGSLVDDGEWTGEKEITLDFTTLNVGSYFVQLTLFNNSLQIYQESFCLTVHPLAPPQIISSPIDQSITWNESLLLSWELFDHTPQSWFVYANGSLFYSESWDDQPLTVKWTVPTLDEGKYNITLLIKDQGGLTSSISLWLTITPPNPPVIASGPAFQTTTRWKHPNTVLRWEVHGGSIWMLFKNTSIAESGFISGKYLEVALTDWDNIWQPGVYNLTLQVTSWLGQNASYSCWLLIRAGDQYANSIVEGRSAFFQDGENALGAPDGEYATIYLDYSNGYITIDMGQYEEIIDGEGADFIVFAAGGTYRVWGGGDLSKPFTMLGTGQGIQNFNLSGAVAEVRYVKIEYFTGANILLDAIEAIHYNLPEGPELPTTSGLDTNNQSLLGKTTIILLGTLGGIILVGSLTMVTLVTIRKRRRKK